MGANWNRILDGPVVESNTMTQLRSTNRLAVLQTIQRCGSISRAQLAKKLSLSKSTITENITSLWQSGVLEESGVGDSREIGGRRPTLLAINGDYCYMVGVVLGIQNPIVALTDLNGKILSQRTLTIPDSAPYSLRQKTAMETIQGLLREHAIPQERLAVIALSSPGAYSASKGSFLLNPEFISWEVDRFVTDLKQCFSTQVFLVNDVNAAAFGELILGAGKGVSNLAYLSCGLGVGVGIICNGELYTGKYGSAGEIAWNPPPGLTGPLRSKVEIGCLMERFRNEVPESSLIALGKKRKFVEFKDFITLWNQRDPFVVQCVEDIGIALGNLLAMITSLLNCERVIFGGEYLAFEEQILPILNQIMQKEAFDPVEVVAARLRSEAGLKGLISLATDVILNRIACGEI